MGGSRSQEFDLLSPVGEDLLYTCQQWVLVFKYALETPNEYWIGKRSGSASFGFKMQTRIYSFY